MSEQFAKLDAFMTSLYRDRYLKGRIIVWTFALLVLPTAFLIALGVPEKPLYISMFVLLVPLQLAVYLFSQRGQSAMVQPKQHSGENVVAITPTHPNLDADWAELLKTTIPRGSVFLYTATVEDASRTWPEGFELNICVHRAYEEAPMQMLISQHTGDNFEQMLMGKRTPPRSKGKKPSAPSETMRDSAPASAFALGQQIRVDAHGLA